MLVATCPFGSTLAPQALKAMGHMAVDNLLRDLGL